MPHSYSIGHHFEKFVADQVKGGRFTNASEVIREGLLLVEQHELRLAALRHELNSAIEEGGEFSADDVLRDVDAHLSQSR